MNVPTPQRQQGAALAIGLIVLVLLTLIGVTGMRSSTLEERMAGNELDRNDAFQAAEASLRGAEDFLVNGILPQFNGNNGYYEPANPAGAPVWETTTWSNGDSVKYDRKIGNAQARYIMEEIGVSDDVGVSLASDTPVEQITFYRVTARGQGASGSSLVMLQTVYKR